MTWDETQPNYQLVPLATHPKVARVQVRKEGNYTRGRNKQQANMFQVSALHYSINIYLIAYFMQDTVLGTADKR